MVGGPGTLAYVELGEFRDVVIVPPLSNITVILKFVLQRVYNESVHACYIRVVQNFFS